MSHELRNPLAAITTAAAVLDKADLAKVEASKLVGSIRRQSQHLARLLDDLLEIGRLTANKLVLRQGAARARRCHSTLRGRAHSDARSNGGRIELELTPAWIDADPVRITQIVENLLVNALKHTPVGRRIRVAVRDAGAVAELRVEDEGFGIDADLLPNVFEPFRQGPQALDRNTGGLGLGLTLVQRLTELHGGTIEASSEGADRGSKFVLRFPSRVSAGGRSRGVAESRKRKEAAPAGCW